MAKRLAWDFVLGDRMSRPATAIAGAVSQVTVSITRANAATAKLGTAQTLATKGTSGFMKELGGLASGLDHAWNVADRFTSKITEVGSAVVHIGQSFLESGIHAARWKEDMKASLDTVLGSSSLATSAMSGMLKLAQHLPMSTAQVFDIGKQFMLMGFKPGAGLNQMITAAADVEGFRGPGAAGAMVDIVRRFKTGAVTGRLLHETLSQVGLSQAEFLDELGKTASGKGSEKDPKGLAKKLEGGQLALSDELTAFLRAIAGHEQGVLGTQSEKSMKTLSGLLTNLQSRWEEFQLGFSDTAGFSKLKSAVENVAGLLDPDSELGKGLSSGLSDLFSSTLDGLVGGFAGPQGVTRITNLFKEVEVGLVSVKEVAVTGIGSAKAFADGFMEGFGGVGDLFGKDGKLNPSTMAAIVEQFHSLGQSAAELARGLGGILHPWESVKKAMGEGINAQTAMAEGDVQVIDIETANARNLDAKRKEWAAAKAKQDTATGRVDDQGIPASAYGPYSDAVGHYAGGGVAGSRGPELAWVGEDEPELITPMSKIRRMSNVNTTGGGGSGVPDVHFHLHVRDGEEGRSDIQELLAQLRSQGIPVMLDAWETLGIQTGRLGPGGN